MRKIINIILIAAILLLGAALWMYGTIEPCAMLAQEFRKDIVVEIRVEDGDQVPEEDMRQAERKIDEAIDIAVQDFSQLQCTDKLMAFWFLDDPYQE